MVSTALDENRDKVRKAITQALIDDPIQALKDLQWLIPKELLVDQTVTQNINVNTNQLADEVLQSVLMLENDEQSPKDLH